MPYKHGPVSSRYQPVKKAFFISSARMGASGQTGQRGHVGSPRPHSQRGPGKDVELGTQINTAITPVTDRWKTLPQSGTFCL